jgi:hypothetical protein
MDCAHCKGKGATWGPLNGFRFCQPCGGNGLRKMVLCETCGNKRCPHATDTSLPCTNSNTSGQPGSSYR